MHLKNNYFELVKSLRGRDGTPLVESLANKFFRNPADAEDACQDVWADLMEDEWNTVRQFKGDNKAAFRAFMVVTIERKLLDIKRRTLKRCQPPDIIKAQGDIWSLAYRLMCCKKHSRREAFEEIKAEYDALGANERLIGDALSGVLSLVKDCGSSKLYEDSVDHLSAPQISNEDMLLRSLLAFVFHHCKKGAEQSEVEILELIRTIGKSPPDFVDALCRALNREAMLTQEQIMILRLFYEYGCTAKEIGERLFMNVNQVNSRRRVAIQRIRKVFEEMKLDKDLSRWFEEQ